MAQISLTFPDGNSKAFEAGVTPGEVAAGISNSLAKKAISATVNGEHYDLQWPITEDAAIAIHTMKDEAQALELIRHDAAHIMARAVQEIWPDVKVTIGPVIENGWYYDFDREEPFTPEDLGADRSEDERDHQPPRSGDHRGLGARPRDQVLRGQQRALQGRADRGDPRRRAAAHVLARPLAGSVPRPASAAHRPGARRRLQADEGGRRLLARRQRPPDAAAHLRRRLPQPRRS